MILVVKEELSLQTIDTIVDFYNGLPESEKAMIYLTSNGGLTKVSDVLASIINTPENRERTKLFAFGEIASSAFHLFFSVGCERELLPGTHGMYHQSSMPIDFNEAMKPNYTYSNFQVEFMKNYCKKSTASVCEHLEFTKAEMDRLNKGKDVWFQPERMQEFLKISNKKREVIVKRVAPFFCQTGVETNLECSVQCERCKNCEQA